MDEQRGEFVGVQDASHYMPQLSLGEVVRIKGVAFRVVVIDCPGRRCTLEMLSAADRAERLSDQAPAANRHEKRTAAALERRQRARRALLGQ